MKNTSHLIAAAIIGSVAFAMPAFAEDGEWTGGYAGIQAGYSAAKSTSNVTLGGAWSSETTALQSRVVSDWSARQNADLGAFGGQIGYNYQASGGFVVGLEADMVGFSGKKDRSFVSSGSPTYTFGNHIDPKSLLSLRAKAGVASGNTLFYATGGWAWARTRMSADVTSNGGYSKEGIVNKTLDGFIIGAGVEHKFSSSISARLDYAYTDQGKAGYDTAYRAGSTFTSPVYSEAVRQDLRLHLVRVGVNFHF